MGVVPFEQPWFRQKSLFIVGLTEFVGTGILCFVIALVLAVNPSDIVAPLTIGAIIICLCHITGDMSGAHFNPCVTLPLFLIERRFSPLRTAVYICAETLGGIAGTHLAIWSGSAFKNPYSVEAHLKQNHSIASMVICEAIFTCILALTCLRAGFLQTQPNPFCPVWVACAVVAASYAAGPISGACLNPSLAIAFTTVSGVWFDLVVYITGPLTGAVMAAIIAMLIDVEIWRRRVGLVTVTHSGSQVPVGIDPYSLMNEPMAIMEGCASSADLANSELVRNIHNTNHKVINVYHRQHELESRNTANSMLQ